ncbi:hypothetical protein LZ31DRAFT_19731 [Colletotrichum somersetense]|nr:hypothetical protein LZ31DRAFT_19731 [Colletotrichum somersetense]
MRVAVNAAIHYSSNLTIVLKRFSRLPSHMHTHTNLFMYTHISTWPNARLLLAVAGYRVLPTRLIMIDPSRKKSLCPFSRVSLLVGVVSCPSWAPPRYTKTSTRVASQPHTTFPAKMWRGQ